jgi:hypothetical protein
MIQDVTKSSSNSENRSRIPLPFVTGGIGLLLAYVINGGLSGGQGFLIGFILGIATLVVRAFYLESSNIKATHSVLVQCSNCGKDLQIIISVAPAESVHLDEASGNMAYE